MGRRRKDERPLPPWAEAIKRARLARGFKTQASFGTAVGYSQQRVADWEAGRARPPAEAAPELARVLGISPKEILPPSLAAAMESQVRLVAPGDVEAAMAALVADVHAALSEAGGNPSIEHATRLALGAWRLAGGTNKDLADPQALREHVQSLRELWRDLANLPRRPR